jgi:branched-chain amino acid transport system ATP-binding protein
MKDFAQLQISDLGVRFGGLVALNGFNLKLRQGELQGLIGPNGAGKTTVFNLITGVYKPTSGSVLLSGLRLDGLASQAIARQGVNRTFQNIRLFSGLSVFDNLLAGAAQSRASGLTGTIGSILGLSRARVLDKAWHERAAHLLDFVGLTNVATSLATSLPYGDQRKLEIARALMMQPRLLLLDEPAAGMNPTEKQALRGLVQKVSETGVSILVIEHDMKFVMNLCGHITVLDHGEVIAAGTPRAVQSDPGVIEAYLGASHKVTMPETVHKIEKEEDS